MSYYLIHYFDEKRNHLNLKPLGIAPAGNSGLYDMDYVQNVIKGQLIAQIIPLSEAVDPNPEYMLYTPKFPLGPNTHIDPDHPNYLLASINGYVFYFNNMIIVKRSLSVRKDVDFNTGNIFFVGDTAIQGSIRAGFEVHSNNIMINNLVEGSIVRARQDIAVTAGVRGGVSSICLLAAGGNISASFIERSEISAGSSILIEKYCLHSSIYCGDNLIIKTRLIGGVSNVTGSVFIGEQLGNSAFVPTKIFLGYDSLQMRSLNRLDKQIKILGKSLYHLKGIAGHLPIDANEASYKFAIYTRQYTYLTNKRTALLTSIHKDEKNAHKCELIVPGCVYPGVEIAIGRCHLVVQRIYENVKFVHGRGSIIVKSLDSSPEEQNTG